MERAWLIMAFISVALSDHPLVRSRKVYRRCADRARKALFDLHCRLEATSEALQVSNGGATPTDDDFAGSSCDCKVACQRVSCLISIAMRRQRPGGDALVVISDGHERENNSQSESLRGRDKRWITVRDTDGDKVVFEKQPRWSGIGE